MKKTLTYLFDPLCGWCYGATPALSSVLETDDVAVELLPTGLFSGQGARPMDDEFAAYAWANDQRIEQLTGQRFTERYREQVLADRQRPFDSGPATAALTAVALTEPGQEVAALKAIQHARYVDGQDVTSLQALADVLRAKGLANAAAGIEHPDEKLLDATRGRIARGREMMRAVGARGVPTFVAEADGKHRVLNASAIFTDPHALIAQLAAI